MDWLYKYHMNEPQTHDGKTSFGKICLLYTYLNTQNIYTV